MSSFFETRVPRHFARLRELYSSIYAVVSPPRCSSTAFSRVLWEQPSVGHYCHEPFETTYYDGDGLAAVASKIASPLDLAELKLSGAEDGGNALVIKEMPYQVGINFPLLAALAVKPIIFLMRDPRLNIASRMAKKREVGDSPFFPAIESGWELWDRQIDWCRSEGLPHLLVDSSDFRNRPLEIFPQVCERLDLPFDADMLAWRPCPAVELDNLGGRHRHLYGAVLASSGILPEPTEPPALESFPKDDGWRDHVRHCLEIYRRRADSEARIRPRGVLSPSPA